MTAIAIAPPRMGSAPPNDRSFFGHPRGLAYLAFTEAWERFSFYGMAALLLLYMIQRLLTPEVMDGVLGLGPFRRALETMTGPLSNRAFASQVFGLYSGLVYFTPLFGGLLADRLLGQRRTVMLGALLMTAGHLLMAFESGFLIALALLIAGSGCLKGNVSTQVGHLYPPDDAERRTRAFAIFSAAINTGAFAGPLLCAIAAQAWGWHAGFGLAIYVKGWAHLPPDVIRSGGGPKPPPIDAHGWRVIGILVLVAAISIPTTLAYAQQFIAGLIFIDESVDRRMLGWTVPASAFVSMDGLFNFILVPPLIVLWEWQRRRTREPGEYGKIAIGYLLSAATNLLMLIPASRIDHDPAARVSLIWPFLLYAMNSVGFLYYWPTLLALFSRAAPRAINATMMGVLFLTVFAGNVIGGALGGWWDSMSHVDFYLLHAAIAVGPLIVMLLIARWATLILAPETITA